MARRRSDDTFTVLWYLFMSTPWWVCPLTAGVTYLGLAYLVPTISRGSVLSKILSDTSILYAPWAAIVVLFIGLLAGLRRWGSGMMLDRQNGVDTINSLTWQEFEELLAAAYRRQGYRVVETGGGPDGGIDLILHGKGEKVLVQCKQWRAYRVGVKPVRELHGVLCSKDATSNRGIFVTFGEYTHEARRFAKVNGIELVDRTRLLAMVEAAQKNRISLDDITHLSTPDAASNEEPQSDPVCPLCGKQMVLRTARRGVNEGSQFWGCSRYPKCRGIVK